MLPPRGRHRHSWSSHLRSQSAFRGLHLVPGHHLLEHGHGDGSVVRADHHPSSRHHTRGSGMVENGSSNLFSEQGSPSPSHVTRHSNVTLLHNTVTINQLFVLFCWKMFKIKVQIYQCLLFIVFILKLYVSLIGNLKCRQAPINSGTDRELRSQHKKLIP